MNTIELAKEAGIWDEIGYPKCIERFAALVRADLMKQEVIALLNVALEALVYHTEQTRPIHKTDEAISQIQNFLDKGATK